MKKVVIFIIICNVFRVNTVFAHWENVHVVVLERAYELLLQKYALICRNSDDLLWLKSQVYCSNNDINCLVSTNDTYGTYPEMLYNIATNSYSALRAGVVYEDHDDPVYELYGISGSKITMTHFWNADYGENQIYELPYGGSDEYNNAWTKARIYLFGKSFNNTPIRMHELPSEFTFETEGYITNNSLRWRSLKQLAIVCNCLSRTAGSAAS